MAPTWDRVRVFAAVARHGSVSAAAQELHLTAPGVSQHVRRLERELGTTLVERSGRGIRLTAAGRVFADHASRASRAVADGTAAVESMSESVVGPVRIGGVATALRALAPALRELLDEHPRVVPTVIDGEIVDLLPKLARGELDVVVTESWDTRPLGLPEGIESRTLVVERVWVALPSGHAYASGGSVELRDLRGETWSSCAAGSDPYEALRQSFGGDGIPPQIAYRVGDMATQLAFVANELAVALVTDLARPAAPAGVTFVPPRPAAARTLAAATRVGRLRPAVAAVIDVAAERLPRAVRPRVAQSRC
ncbi:LysR family transcriptional regulator [Solicola gregarius]|uniref:LysR family transcriptional regulator n=1 Tax=Solicola gregarius TaxID=2908642 RepID=A0AA46YM84_9ACTN|nr:LysR family transcriptional regulator [Solicola gregarius]UYM06389.1 LysR family transcriptional regulator [Solicola gregarius]